MSAHQRVRIFLRDNVFFVHPVSETTRHFWVATAPFWSLPRTDGNALRDRVLEGLSLSKQGIEHPPSTTNLLAPMFKLAGVRSYGAFTSRAIALTVERIDGAMLIVPMLSAESGHGFLEWPEEQVELFDADHLHYQVEKLIARISDRRD